MRISYFLLLIYLCTGLPACSQVKSVSSQDKKIAEWFKEAMRKSRSNDIEKAHELYDKILKRDPTYIDAHLMKGGLYYESGNMDEARKSFRQAIDIDPEYNKEVYYSLALLEDKVKNYSVAFTHMMAYLERSSQDERKYEKATELLAQYEFRANAINHALDIEIEALPFPINTDHSEYVPVFTADGENMIFVRRLGQQEDLFVSQIDSGRFSMPALIEKISTMDNEGVHTISADGKTLIFTACNRRTNYGSCDLYFSHKDKNGEWSHPSNMGKQVNSAAWDSQPSLSADGKTLYFTSNRQGSIGGKDIWYTTKDATGRWFTPRNAGGAINTLGDDATPFIHADGKTLYFRSNGRLGMGGFDLYRAVYDQELERWGIPSNLGYPINTEEDEGGLTIPLDGKMAYYASDKGQDNIDIYRFELPDELRPASVTFIKGRVVDVETNEVLDATVTINNYTDNSILTKETGSQGTFLHALPVGNNFGFTIEKEGYIFYSEKILLDSVASVTEPYLLEFGLIPIKDVNTIDEKPIVLNNIFFASGSADLEERSYAEIERLRVLLQQNSSWHIKIIGHTDNVGSIQDNLTLSQDRAKAVMDALIRKGINASRLSSEGKGEAEPIATNDDRDGRQKNRRTEFVIFRS